MKKFFKATFCLMLVLCSMVMLAACTKEPDDPKTRNLTKAEAINTIESVLDNMATQSKICIDFSSIEDYENDKWIYTRDMVYSYHESGDNYAKDWYIKEGDTIYNYEQSTYGVIPNYKLTTDYLDLMEAFLFEGDLYFLGYMEELFESARIENGKTSIIELKETYIFPGTATEITETHTIIIENNLIIKIEYAEYEQNEKDYEVSYNIKYGANVTDQVEQLPTDVDWFEN